MTNHCNEMARLSSPQFITAPSRSKKFGKNCASTKKDFRKLQACSIRKKVRLQLSSIFWLQNLSFCLPKLFVRFQSFVKLSNTSYQTHSKAIIDFLNGSYVKLGMCVYSTIRLNDSNAFTFMYIQNKRKFYK